MAAGETKGMMVRGVRFVVLVLVTATVLYNASYQQFRDLDKRAPPGDARSYLQMSHGDYNVNPVARYRPVVPMLASVVRTPLSRLTTDSAELDKLQFYVVNFAITVATALLLFGTLARLGFDWRSCFLGVTLFVTSRSTVLFVAVPLVDSLYFFSIGCIVYLTLGGGTALLACTMPFLVLSKETVIPFLFLPLTNRRTRNWKTAGSAIFSVVLVFLMRRHIDHATVADLRVSFDAIVISHIEANILPSLRSLCSLKGIYLLVYGFGLLVILAPLGLYVDWRHRKHKLPAFLLVLVPVAFSFALVSGETGRMFFAAYVPMIAYSLVFIEHCFGFAATEDVAAHNV